VVLFFDFVSWFGLVGDLVDVVLYWYCLLIMKDVDG